MSKQISKKVSLVYVIQIFMTWKFLIKQVSYKGLWFTQCRTRTYLYGWIVMGAQKLRTNILE